MPVLFLALAEQSFSTHTWFVVSEVYHAVALQDWAQLPVPPVSRKQLAVQGLVALSVFVREAQAVQVFVVLTGTYIVGVFVHVVLQAVEPDPVLA